MSPKEKAKELFDKCYYKIEDATAGLFENDVDYLTARRKAATWCSLIAVDEIEETKTLSNRQCGFLTIEKQHKEYWSNVRTEIESM